MYPHHQYSAHVSTAPPTYYIHNSTHIYKLCPCAHGSSRIYTSPPTSANSAQMSMTLPTSPLGYMPTVEGGELTRSPDVSKLSDLAFPPSPCAWREVWMGCVRCREAAELDLKR